MRILRKHRNIVAKRGADGQGGGEDTRGHARPRGKPGRDELEQDIDGWQGFGPFQYVARGRIAAAESCAGGQYPERGHGQSTRGGKQDWPLLAQSTQPVHRLSAQGHNQQPRKQSSGQTAEHGYEQTRERQRQADSRGMDHAEISTIAMDRHRDEARQHDGGDEQTAVALFRHA